jgi:cytochrome c peroxidase
MRTLLVIVLSVMASVGALAQDGALTRDEAYARAQALEALGRKLFFDPALSASGKMACATCHDPAHGFAPANAASVQLGGKDMRQAGIRNVPSLTYLQSVPAFSQHFFESEDEGDSSIDNGPTGGLAWDGRADRGRDQARAPLLSLFEMARRSPPMRTRSFTISACAGRCGRILRTKPSIAASFARRVYVMLRFARASSTTA